MAIVRAHVETVEVIGLDEAYLELTDLAAPHASMRRVRQEIETQTGLGCPVGIGPSKLVAKVASDAEKPRGFVMLSMEQARVRFASAPPGIVPGIGPKTADRLRSLGIDTLAKLAAVPSSELMKRFGPRFGAELKRRAHFEDGSPVSEQRKVVSESRETTFDQDIADMCELESLLGRLVERLCSALVAQGRSGRTVGIKIRLDDFSTHTRARTLPDPVSSADRGGPGALELFRRFDPPRPVRLLGVRVAGLQRVRTDRDEQLTLRV